MSGVQEGACMHRLHRLIGWTWAKEVRVDPERFERVIKDKGRREIYVADRGCRKAAINIISKSDLLDCKIR